LIKIERLVQSCEKRDEEEQSKQFTSNVTLRRVHVTIAGAENP